MSVLDDLIHGCHLGTGVDDCIDIALLPDGGLHYMSLPADRSERVVALCARSSDFITGFFPVDVVVSMADLISGAVSKVW